MTILKLNNGLENVTCKQGLIVVRFTKMCGKWHFNKVIIKVENLLFYCTVLSLQIARRLKYQRRHPHRLPRGAEGCSAAWGWRRAAPRPGGAVAAALGSRSGPTRSEGCSARGRQVGVEP